MHAYSSEQHKQLIEHCTDVIYKYSKMDDIITIYNSKNVLGVLFNTSPSYADTFKSVIRDAINTDSQLKEHNKFSIGFYSTQTHERFKSLIHKAESSMVTYKML